MQQEKVPPGGRKREPRRKTALPARLRTDGTWGDATVLNMSSRGLMIRTQQAIRPGTYLEIRRGTDLAIVGRVVWCSGPYAGIRSQDAIDVEAAACSTARATSAVGGSDRRSSARRPASAAEKAERSRMLGSLIQYVAMAAAVAVGGVIAASVAGDVLHSAFRPVAAAL